MLEEKILEFQTHPRKNWFSHYSMKDHYSTGKVSLMDRHFLESTSKIIKKKRGKHFGIYTMVLFPCKYSLSKCNCHGNISNIPPVPFWPLFLVKAKSNPSPISFYRCLVCCKAFFVCKINSFGIIPWFFLQKSISKSPILFFICLHMVAFKYFQYDFMFGISKMVFAAS